MKSACSSLSSRYFQRFKKKILFKKVKKFDYGKSFFSKFNNGIYFSYSTERGITCLTLATDKSLKKKKKKGIPMKTIWFYGTDI